MNPTASFSSALLNHVGPPARGPLVAAIPAPFDSELSLGPLNLRLYGLMIALGVIVAIWIASKRWERWGGDPDDIITVGIWAVPAGLIGARLYHVITDWGDKYDEGRWPEAFKIWQGGLGIPGGVLLGTIVGVLVARRTVVNWRRLADAAAPAIPVAQAIGRLGNYFNQELYGRPTDLPWGLTVDVGYRPLDPAYATASTYHPTFLYEGLWNLGLAGLIIWGSNRWVFKPARWFAVYVVGYGVGRLWVESLRIDEATQIAGFRVNTWMSLVIIAGGLLWLFWGGTPLDREATERLRGGATLADLFGADTAHVGGSPHAGTEDAESEDASDETGDASGETDADPDEVGETGPGLDGPGSEGPGPDEGEGDPAEGIEPEERS